MFAAPPVLPVMLPALALGPPQPRAPSTTTTTTTTTTAPSVAIAVPVGVPMPVPFPLPVYAQPDFCRAEPRPTACPACPPCHCMPSCTPAFFSFCSPCHQRCRCRSPQEAPVPMPPSPPVALAMHSYPVPLPAPAPLVVVPLPHLRVVKPKTKRKPKRYSSSDTSRTSEDWSEFSSDDGLSSSDSDYFYKKIRRKKKSHKKRRRYPSRRNTGRAGDGEVVKPVLTYVSQNGNIKFKTKISNAQAARLLGARRAPASSERSPAVETVQVVAHEEPEHRPRVVVVSKVEQKVREPRTGAGAGPRRIELREGARPPHDLRPGKKEIVFRPPINKRISNLSVSFQVSE